jgi:hypothetical protein
MLICYSNENFLHLRAHVARSLFHMPGEKEKHD